MKFVNVLLATYNGDKYLAEQIESIYLQKNVSLTITARDDNSSDDTCKILKKYEEEGKLNLLANGPNLGAAQNFFYLLKNADPTANYFAFSDQDDVWLDDKLERALNLLKQDNESYPLIYCGPVIYTDQNLNPLRQSRTPKKLSLENALIENVMTGCTIVMNKCARDLIIKNTPSNCVMHDSWCYLALASFGKIIYDNEPKILYRQHQNNHLGGPTSLFQSMIRRTKRFLLFKNLGYRDQANEFYSIYQRQLSLEQQKIILSFINARNSLFQRIELMIGSRYFRQNKFDDIFFKFIILLNRY